MKGKDSPAYRKRGLHAGEMVSARRLGARKHVSGLKRDKYCLGVLLNSFHTRETILQSPEKRCDKSDLDRKIKVVK
jgi:hypothetical protein